MAAIAQNGLALEFAPEALIVDKDVVLIAFNQNKDAIQYVSNRYNVMELVRKNGLALEFASNIFKKNIFIVIAAVKQNGLALNFASDALRADKNVITAAVT